VAGYERLDRCKYDARLHRLLRFYLFVAAGAVRPRKQRLRRVS